MTSKKLEVINMEGNKELAYTNLLYYNKADFEGNLETYIRVNKIIYKGKHEAKVSKGTIMMNAVMRRVCGVTNGNMTVEAEMIKDYKNGELKKLEAIISIRNEMKNKEMVSIHEDEFIDEMRNKFMEHIFTYKQALLMIYQEYTYVIDIKSSIGGKITEKTKIEITTDDQKLNIITNKVLKRDLFKSDYDFSQLGIGGMDHNLIDIFKRALCTRAFSENTIKKLGTKHIKGILLYGPPGTGKTLIARKISNMISPIPPKIVNGPEIKNKYVGQSEENIRSLFKEAIQDSENNNPNLHVIVFDEIDSICKNRGSSSSGTGVEDGIVSQLLTYIDGINEKLNNIFIIAMTNRKELLDPALLRSGRLEIHIYVGLPDFQGRKQIFQIHTRSLSKSNMLHSSVDFDSLCSLTENFSGSDIESVVKTATNYALHDLLSTDKLYIDDSDIIITQSHLLQAIKTIHPIFGNTCEKLRLLLPTIYKSPSNNYETCCKDILNSINQSYKLKSYLIFGKQKSGKTTLVAHLAYTLKIKFTKLIRPIDLLNFDDSKKIDFLSSILLDSFVSDDSLLILDDIDLLINYVSLGNNIYFSPKLYQLLLTMLKSSPPTINNKLSIIMTCTNPLVYSDIKENFDHSFEI